MLMWIFLLGIGFSFYKLAEKYKKSKWGFAILGVIAYYAGTFLFGIFLGVFYELMLEESIDSINGILLNFMALPFGLATCYGLYKLLESRWKKPALVSDPEILDSQLSGARDQLTAPSDDIRI